MLIYGKIFKIYYLKEGDIMEHEGKNQRPYKGVLLSSLILIGVPALLFLIVFLVVKKYGHMAKDITLYFSMMIGIGCGLLFQVSCVLCGLLKGTFKVVVNRVKNFFSNLSVNFKFAFKYYIEDIKTDGVVFWIFFLIISVMLLLSKSL